MNPKGFSPRQPPSCEGLAFILGRLDGSLVAQDISAHKIEVSIGWEFAKAVDRIEASLKATCDIGTVRRRKRLNRQWKDYDTAVTPLKNKIRRRHLGHCGQNGLLLALSLVSADATAGYYRITARHRFQVVDTTIHSDRYRTVSQGFNSNRVRVFRWGTTKTQTVAGLGFVS
jgi:hypothetical protein